MATPPKTEAAKAQEAEQAAIEAAVAPPDPAPARTSAHDKQIAKAHDAELKRQEVVVDAVAKANADELPALGGVWLEPGLGR